MLGYCTNKEIGFGCPSYRIEIGLGFRQKPSLWVRQCFRRCDPNRLFSTMYYESVQNPSLQFSPIFLHTLSALFSIQFKSFRKTHEVTILPYAYCYQSKRKLADMAWCSLIFKLRLLYQSFWMLACSQLPKFV